MEQTVTNDAQAIYITEIGGRPYLINEPDNRIEFLDQRFYATPSGGMVPSVTTILEMWPKGAQYYEWLKKHGKDADEIRDEAGRRGSRVHNITEGYDRGIIQDMRGPEGEPRYKMAEWAMFERYLDFRRVVKPGILEIERRLVSDKLGTGGTLDRVLTIGDEVWIIDLKTSNAIYDHYHLQTAAYLDLLAECDRMPAERVINIRRGILHVNAATKTYGRGEAIQGPGWKLEESGRSYEEDLDLFYACQKLWHATNRNTKPKNISYQLSHNPNQTAQ